MKVKKLPNYERDAIAGLPAAAVAIILHFLYIADEDIILPIILILPGLVFINFMRRTSHNRATAQRLERTEHTVRGIQTALKSPDILLVGQRHVRSVSEQFALNIRGNNDRPMSVCQRTNRSSCLIFYCDRQLKNPGLPRPGLFPATVG